MPGQKISNEQQQGPTNIPEQVDIKFYICCCVNAYGCLLDTMYIWMHTGNKNSRKTKNGKGVIL